MISLSCLPDEIVTEILSLLDQNSITSFCQTCSKFNRIGIAKLKERIVVVPKTRNNVYLDGFELLQTFTYGFTKVKEDRFTDLYSHDFFIRTRELACLEVYKRRKLQDYKAKLPRLQNFFTFDSKSYEWYEDFKQYLWTADINIANQYQSRVMQRIVIPSDRKLGKYVRMGGMGYVAQVSGTEDDSAISDSDTEDGSLIQGLEHQLLNSTRKLYTKMNEKLEYFKFSNYRKFKKLKYLYLASNVPVDNMGFNLKLTSFLFLTRFDNSRYCYYKMAEVHFREMSDNEIDFINRLPEYPDEKFWKPNFSENDIFNLPINWKYLKEIRFALRNMDSNFSKLAKYLESLEYLYIHDMYDYMQGQTVDFILNINENILHQLIIYVSGYFSKLGMKEYKKEQLQRILSQQKCLVNFSIRYGKTDSFEVQDLINSQPYQGFENT